MAKVTEYVGRIVEQRDIKISAVFGKVKKGGKTSVYVQGKIEKKEKPKPPTLDEYILKVKGAPADQLEFHRASPYTQAEWKQYLKWLKYENLL